MIPEYQTPLLGEVFKGIRAPNSWIKPSQTAAGENMLKHFEAETQEQRAGPDACQVLTSAVTGRCTPKGWTSSSPMPR